MSFATLRQFAEMLNSLPDSVKDKPICWIDISCVYADELEEMKERLEKSSETQITLC